MFIDTLLQLIFEVFIGFMKDFFADSIATAIGIAE